MPRKRHRTVSEDDTFSPALRKAIEDRALSLSRQKDLLYPDTLWPSDHLDALVGELLFEQGIQFRFTPDRDGQIWAKACIRTAKYPRHYVLASFPPGTPFTTCLEGLLRKVEAFHEGALRPSPDKWPG